MSELTRPQRTKWEPPRIDWVLPVIIKRWQFIVIAASLIILALLTVVLIRGAIYEVKAQILVKLGREISFAAVVGDQQAIPNSKRPEDIATEVQLMLSPQVIAELVDQVGVDNFYAKPPAHTLPQMTRRLAENVAETINDAIERVLIVLGLRREMSRRDKIIDLLRGVITAEPISRSDVIEITMKTKDPEVGRMILDRMIELYTESHIRAFKTGPIKTFFENETRKLHQQLESAEAERAKLKSSSEIWSSADQRRLLLDWQQRLWSKRMSTLTLIAGVEAENVQLKLSSAKMPENLRLSVVENRNSVIDKLLNRLSDKVANQAQLKLRYGNDSRAVLDGEKEIEYTRDAIAKEKELITDSVTRGPNTGRHKLQGIIIAQQAKIASLRAENQQTSAQLSEVGEKLRNLDAKEMGIHRLEREIDRLERDWMLYTKNYGEAKIFEEMDLAKIANIAVISRPASSLKPVAPKLKLILLGSLIMGFGAPIAWVLFTDFLRPVVRSRDDVASLLGAPVLARIPEARKS